MTAEKEKKKKKKKKIHRTVAEVQFLMPVE